MIRSNHRCVAILLFMLSGLSAPAWPDEIGEIKRLHSAGQSGAAVQRLQRLITAKPSDPAPRFLLGVIFADTQRNADAIDIFDRLTLDHAELAEAHNNLAVLHSAAGDYDKARTALELALRGNPDYAVAQENLGDVYIMLASQSYARAARLEPGNSSLPPKIALLKELLMSKTSQSLPRTGTAPCKCTAN